MRVRSGTPGGVSLTLSALGRCQGDAAGAVQAMCCSDSDPGLEPGDLRLDGLETPVPQTEALGGHLGTPPEVSQGQRVWRLAHHWPPPLWRHPGAGAGACSGLVLCIPDCAPLCLEGSHQPGRGFRDAGFRGAEPGTPWPGLLGPWPSWEQPPVPGPAHPAPHS